MHIPVIDLSRFPSGDEAQRRAIGREVDRACREVGFFSITGHGVDEDTITNAHRAALEFFELPHEARMGAAKPEPTYPYGYTPFSGEALNRSIGGAAAPDLKETYSIGPVGKPHRPLEAMTEPYERDVWAVTPWPDAMPNLRSALEAYHRAMSALAELIMETFTYALGLHAGWFAPFIDAPGSALRLAHYPPLVNPQTPTSSGLERTRTTARSRFSAWTPSPGFKCRRPTVHGQMSMPPRVPSWSTSAI